MSRAALLLPLVACAGQSLQQAAPASKEMAMEEAEEGANPTGGSGARARRAERGNAVAMDAPMGGAPPPPAATMPSSAPADGFAGELDDAVADKDRAGNAEAPAPARSWFPETFLFAPRLVTGADGQATVQARVPDRLTSWRVLGLAHDRSGALGGAVTELAGRLPVSVDPVVPPFLRAGDLIELPVQALNTTAAPVAARLDVRAEGGVVVGGSAELRLEPGGAAVHRLSLGAGGAGALRLRVDLSGPDAQDAVERQISVLPTGRPVAESARFSLAEGRDLALPALPTPEPASARATLVIVPGARAVLQGELDGAAARLRAEPAAVAAALWVAAEVPGLLQQVDAAPTGVGAAEAQARAADRLKKLATQYALHLTRAPELPAALLIGPAAARHPQDPLLVALADRMLDQLATAQRPDGTFGGEADTAWPLQRLLATTAAGAAAAAEIAAAPAPDAATAARRARIAEGVRLKASLALGRQRARVADPYTAALALRAGVDDPEARAALVALIEAAIERPAGADARLSAAGAVGPDGRPPSALALAAAAVLGLDAAGAGGPADALLGGLLSGWSPGAGFGDPAADLLGAQAVSRRLGQGPPPHVVVQVRQGGQLVAEAALGPEQLRGVHIVDVPYTAIDGAPWRVDVDPPAPGLAASLTLSATTAWTSPPATAGLELRVTAPEAPQVGRIARIGLVASAPAGQALQVELRLPAGVVPDGAGLDARVRAGELTAWSADDAALRLELPAPAPAQLLRVDVPVVPTLAGRLSTGPAALRRGLAETLVAPAVWTVRPG
jgi:hypothetical protein